MKSYKNILQNRRTPHFMGELGVTVRLMHLILINGPDQMHQDEPLQIDHGRQIADRCSRCNMRFMRYETRENASVGSRSNASDAFDRVKSGPL